VKYIELFGPSGAGKSTLHSHLIKSSDLFGGTTEHATRRLLYKKIDHKSKLKLIYRFLPPSFRDLFEDEFLEYRLGHSVLDDFIREYPRFIIMISNAMKSVSYEPERVFSMCMRAAERFQIGVETVKDNEILCLDESFVSRLYSIIWRDKNNRFSIDRYFSAVPTPEIAIFVDAPVDTCLNRQRERGRLCVSKEWETNELEVVQNKSREICLQIRDYLKDDATIVSVENTGAVIDTANQIEKKISSI